LQVNISRFGLILILMFVWSEFKQLGRNNLVI